MATKVYMEALSPTMEEGRLVSWHKAEGDPVKSGDVIAEVETDKAVMELVARGDGVLRARLLAEGETAPVGQLVGVIAEPSEDIAALIASSKPQAAPAAAATAAQGTAPAVAPSPPSPPAPAPAAPASASPPPPSAPAPAPAAKAAPPSAPAAAPPKPAPSRNGGRVRSSPLARRVASERGLELAAIAGSGPNGRIIKRDVESAVAAPPAAARQAAPAVERPRVVPAEGDFHDVSLTQIRKTIAKRLAESIGPVPTFYLTADYDVERMAEMRTAMVAEGEQFKVSFNDILLKAVATALAQHPEVNAHWLGDRIRYFNRVHIGIAVAIDDGLITPVLFGAEAKSLRQIAEESRVLAARARARKLTPSEYTGSTFSVSNLGMFGIEQFTAIINPPEAGILAAGAVEPRPVVVDGAVVVRRRMRVTMSCDHRVIDGATGARFLQTLRRLVENPLMLVY
jgi:pyruvate dehydrogenase E2 component (dihydrolipoyllysine-residue acetyltransferase)